MIRKILAATILITTLLVPQVSAAYNPLHAACSSGGGSSNSVACGTNGSNTLTGSNGAINKITRIIAAVAGVAAVIVIMVGGIMYMSSGGDPQQTSKARSTILFALVGLAIIILAQAIITFIISKV